MKNYAKKILLATSTTLLLSAGLSSAAAKVEMALGSITAESTISVPADQQEAPPPCVNNRNR